MNACPGTPCRRNPPLAPHPWPDNPAPPATVSIPVLCSWRSRLRRGQPPRARPRATRMSSAPPGCSPAKSHIPHSKTNASPYLISSCHSEFCGFTHGNQPCIPKPIRTGRIRMRAAAWWGGSPTCRLLSRMRDQHRRNRGGGIPWGRRPLEPADQRSAPRVKALLRGFRASLRPSRGGG